MAKYWQFHMIQPNSKVLTVLGFVSAPSHESKLYKAEPKLTIGWEADGNTVKGSKRQ